MPRTWTACEVLHPWALRLRWIHDLHATFCDLCGCIYVPDDQPSADATSSEARAGRGVGASASRSSLAAASAVSRA